MSEKSITGKNGENTKFVLGGNDSERLQIAMARARSYGERELLIKEIRKGNPLLSEEEPMKLIADLLAGSNPLGKHKKPKSREKERKRQDILVSLSRHFADGKAIWSDSPALTGREYAVPLVSTEFNVGESTVKSVWRDRARLWPDILRKRILIKPELIARREIYLATGMPAKSESALNIITEEVDWARMMAYSKCQARLNLCGFRTFHDDARSDLKEKLRW